MATAAVDTAFLYVLTEGDDQQLCDSARAIIGGHIVLPGAYPTVCVASTAQLTGGDQWWRVLPLVPPSGVLSVFSADHDISVGIY